MNTLRPSTSTSEKSRRIAAVAALAMAHGITASAADNDAPGDDDPVQLDDFNIEDSRIKEASSPKFTAPLLDTPQTIAVLPSAVFNQQAVTTLSDVLRNTPGITFAAGEGGGVAAGDSFYMRGFDASDSIFVDGVRDSGTYFRDVYNVEQVEIAKGPAGADNGRGGSSGYVNLATKMPQPAAFARAQLSYGGGLSSGQPEQRATLDINEPLGDRVGLRLNAMWQDTGTAGRDAVFQKSYGIAPSLALDLSPSSRVVLTGSYEEQDGLPDSGLPIVALPGFAGREVDQGNFYGLEDYGFEKVENTKLGVRFEQRLGGNFDLTYQTRYIDTSRDMLITRPSNSGSNAFNPETNEVFPTSSRLPQEYEILAHQLNVSGRAATGRISHSLSAGLEATDESRSTETWTNGTAFGTDLLAPDRNRVPFASQLPARAANEPFTDSNVDTRAIYAFDTLGLTEKLHLTLSARWEDYDITYKSLAAASTANPSPEAVTLEKSAGLFSYKAGLNYKPSPAGSIYLAFANSEVPPGSNFTLSTRETNVNNPAFDPQEATNIEAGIKWDLFGDRLSTSLAVYRSRNKNTPSTDAATGEITQNISQTSEGVELGVSGRITPDWLVYGGIGLIDTSYDSAGTTAGGNDGAELRFAPKLSGNLWTTYALTRGLTVGGGLQYTDPVARSTSNSLSDTATSLSRIPSYWLVNLMAAYAVNENLTLRFNMENVFDETNFRLNNNGGRYYPGVARSARLTASLSF